MVRGWMRLIQLRFEQELIILRYALLCKTGKLTRFLLIVRPIFILLSILLVITTLHGAIYAKHMSQYYLNVGLLAVYIVFLINLMWESGLSSDRFQKWKNAIVFVILLQCTSIVALAVLEVSDEPNLVEFAQNDPEQVVRELPGGIQMVEIAGMQIEEILLRDSIEIAEDGVIEEEEEDVDLAQVELKVVGTPLNYPNPCRLGAEGTTIGYFLTRDADIEVRIYDPFAREITKLYYTNGDNGGKGGDISNPNNYNRIAITETELGTNEVPAGIYYYVIIGDNKALARGRIAALP